MRRVRLLHVPFLALAFSLSLLLSPLFAQTFKPVFTKQYTRLAGTPVTVSDPFTACDARGIFRVVVLNGAGGQGRISSGSIFVNGLEVIKEQDFNQQVSRTERSLTGILLNNQIEVRLKSGPGAAVQVTVEGIQNCLGITITSPAPGSVINRSSVLVLGEVHAPTGAEVGVTVNSFPGLVANSQFTAMVPVDSTVTSLTATAIDAAGSTATDTISVIVQPPTAESPLLLRASPPGGLAPLTVGFQLSSLVGVSQVALDLEGDGTADFQGTSLEGQTFIYSQPGVYTPTVQVTDLQGQAHSAVTIVQVLDQASLDARLQAVWQGLKDALRSGDVARAATFIHGDARARYQAQFTRFSPATLANIDQYMTTIQLVEVGFAGAQYKMRRERNGKVLSFAVWFQIDQDGRWRVRRF